MTNHTDPPDALTRVARYRPTELMSGWASTHADATLLAVLGTQPAAESRASESTRATEIPLQFGSRHSPTRHRAVSRVLPVAASVAVLAAGLLTAVLLGTGSDRDQAAGGQPFGPRFTPPAGLSNHAIGKHQYTYRLTDQFDIDPSGHANRRGKDRPDAMVMRNYIAPDGSGISIRTGDQHGCVQLTGRNKTVADAALFASMPTNVDKLERYFRSRARGSSSKDAAVFAEISDDLAFDDGLASPRLRAAMLAVLSRTPGVRLHFGEHDFLGRKAIRADFADPPREGPLVRSLYFDPTDFHLLESRSSNDDAPWTYTGPTPVYSAAPPTTSDDPNHLIGQSLVELNRVSRMVKHVPQCH